MATTHYHVVRVRGDAVDTLGVKTSKKRAVELAEDAEDEAGAVVRVQTTSGTIVHEVEAAARQELRDRLGDDAAVFDQPEPEPEPEPLTLHRVGASQRRVLNEVVQDHFYEVDGATVTVRDPEGYARDLADALAAELTSKNWSAEDRFALRRHWVKLTVALAERRVEVAAVGDVADRRWT